MTAGECLKILREVKDAAFATVDEQGKPQVRMIDVMVIEGGRIYFCTSRGKDFYRQLMHAGEIAVMAMNPRYQMVRLEGKSVRVADSEQRKWIDRIFEDNPSMKGVYPGESRYILEAFYIEDGSMEFFDLGCSPIYRETFVLGKGEGKEKGFLIHDTCIGCGICKENCPQHCIVEGSPYEIRQENCLHCGLCLESCPVQAIERKGV